MPPNLDSLIFTPDTRSSLYPDKPTGLEHDRVPSLASTVTAAKSIRAAGAIPFRSASLAVLSTLASTALSHSLTWSRPNSTVILTSPAGPSTLSSETASSLSTLSTAPREPLSKP